MPQLTAFASWRTGLSASALITLLAACSSTRPPSSPAAAAPASAAASSANEDTSTQTNAVPHAAPELTKLPGNPNPDSYANRPDAKQLAQELAAAQGLDPDWAWQALSRARFKESATRFIMPAANPGAKNWGAYRNRFIEPIRLRAGLQFWREHRDALERAEQTYGVPVPIILGILGVETIYGRQMGNYRALDALATLSLDFPRGRSDRSPFFRQELGQFLRWCQDTGTAPDSVMSSFAGAIGMPQFMPSSIRRYAVDFDQDGRIDLQRSADDAIGSVAHYLAEQGWVSGLPAYFDVTPPDNDDARKRLLAPDILPTFSAEEMRDSGAKLPDAAFQPGIRLALVQLLNGDAAPTLVAGTPNFYAITRYNQSSYYALAVIQLGEALRREQEKSLTLR